MVEVGPHQLHQPLEQLKLLEAVRDEPAVADVPEAVSGTHRQRLFLGDHEHVDDAAGEAFITVAFEDDKLEEPPGDFDWQSRLLAANPDILEDKVVQSLDRHPQHQTPIFLELLGQVWQAKRDIVAELSGDDILPRVGCYEVLAPAQRDHDPAERVKNVHFVVQVVEEQSRDVNVRLLVKHVWVKDAICSDDSD